MSAVNNGANIEKEDGDVSWYEGERERKRWRWREWECWFYLEKVASDWGTCRTGPLTEPIKNCANDEEMEQSDTALNNAAWKGHRGVVELLLNRGARVDHPRNTVC